MKTTLTRLFTVMMLIIVSMGAMADVKVLFGEKGDDKFKTDGDKIEATYDGGTIVVTQKVVDATKVTVFLTVTPNKGYTMQEKNVIEAYATAPANIGKTRAPLVSEKLTFDCDDFKDEYSTRTYYTTIPSSLALWVKKATFTNKREGAKSTATYTFYVINNNGRASVYANATVETTSTVLDAFKTTSVVSPFIADNNYYFYDTEAGAVAATGLTNGGGNGSSVVGDIDTGDKIIYVRYYYANSSSPIDLSGTKLYNIMVGGRYFADNVNRNRPETKATGEVTEAALLSDGHTNNYHYLWKLTGNDPYNISLTSSYTPGDRFLWGAWNTSKGGSATKMYVNNGVDVGSNNNPIGTIQSTNLYKYGSTYSIASFILLPHSSGTDYVLMAATTSVQPNVSNQYAYQSCQGSGYKDPYVLIASVNNAEVVSLFAPFVCQTPTFSYNTTNNEVTIESETEGATIYYTLTGDDPVVPNAGDPVSPTKLYDPNSKPTVNSRAVVKAVAVKSGKANSDVASTTIVTNPVITLAEGPFTYSGSAIAPSVSSVKDVETVIDPSEYTVGYSDNTDAGTATVTITDAEDGGYIVYGSTTFTIAPKELTVTADTKTKGYGDDEPVLTYTYSGLVNGDNIESILEGALSRETGENSGTYAIGQGTLASTTANYSIEYHGATFTITQKSLGSGTIIPAEGINIDITKNGNGTYSVRVTQGSNENKKVLSAKENEEDTEYDYILSEDDSDPKYHQVTITGYNNYTGSAIAKYVNMTFGTKENTNYFATFVSGDGDLAAPAVITPSIVTGINDNTVTGEDLEYIPGNVPVILLFTLDTEDENDENNVVPGGFTLKPAGSGVTEITEAQQSSNMLVKATGSSSDRTKAVATIYLLYNGEFVLNMAGEVPEGKVYLDPEAGSGNAGSRPFGARLAIIGGRTTGINSASLNEKGKMINDKWYDLTGRRLSGKPTAKGVYVNGGKKVVIR